MKKLTWEMFKTNKYYVLAVTKEQRKKRNEWLKENGFIYLNHSTMNNDFVCYGGFDILESFAYGIQSFENVYTVDQLDWKPKQVHNFEIGDTVRMVEDKKNGHFIRAKVGNTYKIVDESESGYTVLSEDGFHQKISKFNYNWGKFVKVDVKEISIKDLEKEYGCKIKITK